MKLFYKVIFSGLILSSFSCSTSKLTNYGKPLSFLSKERVPRKKAIKSNEFLILNNDFKKNISLNNNENQLDLNCTENSFANEKPTEPLSLFQGNENQTVSELKKVDYHKKNNKIDFPIIGKKIKNVINNNKVSNQFNTLGVKDLSNESFLNDDISDLVLLLICLLFPPVAVWWRYDFREQFWIDLALYAPMIFLTSATFAILPVLYAIYVCFLKKKGNTGDVRSSW